MSKNVSPLPRPGVPGPGITIPVQNAPRMIRSQLSQPIASSAMRPASPINTTAVGPRNVRTTGPAGPRPGMGQVIALRPNILANHNGNLPRAPTNTANLGEVIYVDGKPVVYNKANRKIYTDQKLVAFVEDSEQDKKMASDALEETQSEEVFSTYKCHSVPEVYECKHHPGNLVEAGSLSAQLLPELTYNLQESIPKDVLSGCSLSDLQMEGILFACQRHQLLLPGGKRAGFFLGDGTGVGKGRQIAGIILDNLARGRKKHIWFSVSSDLRNDAQRDLEDIGCYTHIINGCQQLDKKTKAFGLVSEFQEGILFSTYSTLVSIQQSHNARSRLDQLVKWCGDNFEGCLIFDECHKAKNFIPGSEGKSAKVAVAVTMIQRVLPKARVVYCSATGVTDVKNMAFMERLGLWGLGSTFPTFEAFLDSLTKRGLGALEMLSIEMKAGGMYVSRGLSYKEAEFETVEAVLTKDQESVYDQAVSLWNELKLSLEIAHKRVGMANSRVWTSYWASHQRFFKNLCMSMKVPEIVRIAKNALDNNCSVVIGLQTTGEAGLDSELDQNDGDLKGFVSLTKEILKRFVFQFFPTEKVASAGELSCIDDWCVKTKCMLIDLCEKIDLPDSPLDEIMDKLGGPNEVAEMTGRKGFIGRYRKQDKPRYFSRSHAFSGVESINMNERNAFMDGGKFVALISDASSTGISLHADMRAGNQKRRVHITAELPWSADKAVQQLGRSHRSNQSSGPIYKLITSNLGGERRFVSAVARRLQSLGAITKGDRRAASGANLTEFNFDTPYGHQALKHMYDGILQKKVCIGVDFEEVVKRNKLDKGLSLEEFNEGMKKGLESMCIMEQGVAGTVMSDANLRNVRKFLNRILGLEVKKQNLFFDYFCCALDATTKAAKREGRYNDGVTDLRGNSIAMGKEPEIVFKEAQLGMSVTMLSEVLVDRGVPFKQAKDRYEANKKNTDNGFYRSKREQYGKLLFLLAIQKEHSNHLFTVCRPNTGFSPFEEDRTTLLQKYEKIRPSIAEKGWNKEYEYTKDHCIHGKSCKYGDECSVGSRITKVHLLTGRILSILPSLETVVAMFGHSLQLSKDNRNLRVVRVELDNGKRLVGLRYPYILISEVEKYMKEQRLSNPIMAGSISAITESQTAVNKKSLAKALTKPPTIKTFFSVMEPSDNCGSKDAPKDDRNAKKVKSKNASPNTSKIDKEVSKKKILPPPAKKRKQSNIFNMIVTQKEKKKPKTCPVCSKNFEETTAEEEINSHIDNCLID